MPNPPQPNPQPQTWWPPHKISTSPLEDISDLLDNFSLPECVELTRRILASIPSLHTRAARTRSLLHIIIIFAAEYGNTP